MTKCAPTTKALSYIKFDVKCVSVVAVKNKTFQLRLSISCMGIPWWNVTICKALSRPAWLEMNPVFNLHDTGIL